MLISLPKLHSKVLSPKKRCNCNPKIRGLLMEIKIELIALLIKVGLKTQDVSESHLAKCYAKRKVRESLKKATKKNGQDFLIRHAKSN